MIEAIIYIAIGAFIGWSVPQPEWAKSIQAKVVGFFKGN
jgi:hypothetical protein